jgi:hypothetical protein
MDSGSRSNVIAFPKKPAKEPDRWQETLARVKQEFAGLTTAEKLRRMEGPLYHD